MGKASPNLEKGASIGWGHEEISIDTFEVLLGDQRAVHWADDHGHLNIEKLGARPVEGGRDGDGTPLYICQRRYRNTPESCA